MKKDFPQWVSDFFGLPMTPEEKKIVKRLQEDVQEGAYEMKPVYSEIEKKLESYKILPIDGVIIDGKVTVLKAILTSAIIIESERKKNLKKELTDKRKLQRAISAKVKQLIALLDEHERKQMDDGAWRPHQKPIELIMAAGCVMLPVDRRRYFKTHVASVLGMNSVLRAAKQNRNGEYMPKLQEVLQVLKNRMDEKINTSTGLEKILLGSRKSVANNGVSNGSDFIRVLARGIRQEAMLSNLPNDFTMTAKSLATITRRVLCLDDYTEAAVKKVFKNM